jgi:ABC-type polysaccharide/polyol phosphate transport system ATPase subunit
MPIDLRLDHVSKRYWIRQESVAGQTASGWFGRLRNRFGHRREFWALQDVSFEVPRGQALGIIGHNGAGKSTILKLLSSITAPTRGEITIAGRIAALLEVGSGFHPELTGRENVFLSGSILGMKRKEIHAKLDSIIEFAEVRPFIDVPVKRYSSGMYVRLGFSIAAHLEPDILLLDEVLAVGDATFQQKCQERIHNLHREGTTIVFISHDLAAVEEVCDRVLLLDRGQVVFDGDPDEVILKYQKMAAIRRTSEDTGVDGRGKKAHLRSVMISDCVCDESLTLKTGFPMKVRIEYLALEPLRAANFSVYFHSPDGILYSHLTTRVEYGDLDLKPGPGSVEFICPELGLQPGIYSVDATIETANSIDPVERLRQCLTIRVDPGRVVRGLFYAAHQCRVETAPEVPSPRKG